MIASIEDEVSEARSLGRKKGTSAPALIATEAISSQSVDTIKSFTKEHWRPWSIDQLIRGNAQRFDIFTGQPFDPPRARIIPKQEKFLTLKTGFTSFQIYHQLHYPYSPMT